MPIDLAPIEIHSSIETCTLEQKLSTFVEQLFQLEPHLIMGESKLFQYDGQKHSLFLSPAFKNLLLLLVELNQLDPQALRVKSLAELNAILQKPQGFNGGLMRNAGIERWQLEDSLCLKKYQDLFHHLFKELGFLTPTSCPSSLKAHHCLIFGASVERMEKRIFETIKYLKNNLEVSGQIFLLGSERRLTSEEIRKLQDHLQRLDKEQKTFWEQVFEIENEATEANAFAFLWNYTAPVELQNKYKDKLVLIKSNRIGPSYQGNQGHRATLEVTITDWLAYYNNQVPQTIFAVVEFPYLRLLDQLRFIVLTNDQKASLEEFIQRFKNTNFNFIIVPTNTTPAISLILDEIGRNVYKLNQSLNYYYLLEFN